MLSPKLYQTLRQIPNARSVALALCKVNPQAGQTHNVETPQTVEQRAENLLKETLYGPYVADGDPHDWGGGEALVTIYMEPKGVQGDCAPPPELKESLLL